MKKPLLLFALLVCATLLVSAQSLKFETLEINYGTIAKGSDPVREFKFTNTGTTPVTILNALGSSSWLVPTWPKNPVLPGQTGVIKAEYDTHRIGIFTKYIILTTDASGQESVKLTVTGTVEDSEHSPN
jgi:hypothetical protein